MSKPILVGESNPYGGDPYFALYPAPDGCSGHRLATLILGMSRHDYLDAFERVNLCVGKWSVKLARKITEQLSCRDGGARIILLGSKVCGAFGMKFDPFTVSGLDNCRAVLPHPSGRNLLWNNPDSIIRTREVVLKIAPELQGLIGIVSGTRQVLK